MDENGNVFSMSSLANATRCGWQLQMRHATSTIRFVRDRTPFGLACGVTVSLTINGRMAPVTVSWHYAFEGDAPRLVTAFPIP